jgi:dGTPase
MIPEKIIKSSCAYNNHREECTLSQFACMSRKGTRIHAEEIPDELNVRPTFSHDGDRIMNSKAFSRYADKTQVFSFFKNDHIQHRVLHVQLVSKIARSIGRTLHFNEDLIEAIALGHDLGHAPFGHDGERFLNEICVSSQIGCFCHNAQSVRLLMEIEKKGRGLNLTLQVLDGILCHNGELISQDYRPKTSKTWEEFQNDYSECFKNYDYKDRLVPMTLEGCVVRLADFIAYIGRDIEDAIRLKVIKFNDIPNELIEFFGIQSKDTIHKTVINKLAEDLITESYEKDCLSFSSSTYEKIGDLKKFSKSIYQNHDLMGEVNKTKKMFKELFEHYVGDFELENTAINDHVSEMTRPYLENNSKERIVIDYLASMTDDYFLDKYQAVFVPQSLGYGLKESQEALPVPPEYHERKVFKV